MIEKIKKFIHSNNLLPSEISTVYVAVSGGIDSCVLLYLLNHLKNNFGVSIHVLHFNHKTRGGESDRDEAFVTDLANQYGLDIRLGELKKKGSKYTETYLREKRYKFFQTVINSDKKVVVATGHNRDDNIETFLMRLAKGSRLRGLMAIPPSRSGYIRPILCFSRSEIASYARKKGIKHIDDSSNSDLSVQRNLLRHRIIPYLKNNLNENFDQNITRVIHNLSLYNELFEEKLKEAVEVSVRRSGNNILLNRKSYLKYNEVVRRGLLEYCISNLYPVNYKVSDRNYFTWDEFVEKAQSGKKITFLNDGMAVAERNQILFGDIPEARPDSNSLGINRPNKVNDNFNLYVTRVTATDVMMGHNKNVEFIDGQKSGSQLSVRYWHEGDHFQPLGMNHRKKLSDFFIDLKLDISLKKEIPLVCNDDRIIWITGYRLDDYFKITADTKLFYKLELKKTT